MLLPLSFTKFAFKFARIMKNEPTYSLLNAINYPKDLRQLSVDQLPEVCEELRQDIIKELSCNPGHFAASLGVVELTVALHYVYNTPYDRIVWDVGHQAYGHKILTGRREAFSTNRKLGGIRPFPSPEESEYDTFTCGHASNSISAALGMAVAAERKGEKDRHVVAVIGDGSMSGGLAFEGLNNASSTANNLLIILNDNDMAIDRSVGGMKQYLFNLTTSNRYNQLRFKTSRLLFKMGLLNEERRKALIRLGNSLKSLAAQQQNIFEGMNIRYFGPIDGHDVKNIARILHDIKDMQGPKILHLHTIKGKGFGPAEKQATIWHAPGKFDPVTGKRIVANTDGMPPLFQDVFGHTLIELAEKNKRIMGVTPAMPSGCSMNMLMDRMPDRAFDVGIAEGHAVTFSAGLAAAGMVPFCNIYSSFMQRAYDNVIHDVAIQDLPVVMCLDRGGLVGEDGVTNENSPETDSKKAWGGDIVLKLQTEKPDTFTFKLISSLDLDVLKAVYGDGNVSGTLADGITVTATGEELPEKQWVIDMVMRDNAVKRIYIPSGSISEIGEIVYKDDEEVGYELTIMAMPGSDGATHKEFIKRAAGTGGG